MWYDEFVKLLEHEMVPALGCTDPIGIAFCAASAARYSRGELKKVEALYSMNLIKNVAAVTIPNTNGLYGARIATAVGITGGNPDRGLEVLADLTPQQVEAARELEKSERLEIAIAGNDIRLYMQIAITSSENTVTAVVQDEYTNLVSLCVDGVEQLVPSADNNRTPEKGYAYEQLSIASILDFASNVPFEKLSHIEEAVKMNTALAREGMERFSESRISKIVCSSYGGENANNMQNSAVLWSLAGVEARMAGCPLAAMSNTGSGNQGIVCTLPVYGASLTLKSDYETLIRATALSCLTAIYIKHKLGNLSTVCGCTVACTGAGCGIAYLRNGSQEEMLHVLKNMFGNVAGLLCDGAKVSCALKAATCVSAACLASDLAVHGFGLADNNGIVGRNERDTIEYFVRTSNEGLISMDGVVLDIIMNKN